MSIKFVTGILCLALLKNVVKSSFNHTTSIVSDGSRNLTFKNETLKSFVQCLLCDRSNACVVDIHKTSATINVTEFVLNSFGKEYDAGYETYRTCLFEKTRLVCRTLPLETLHCVKNITVLHSSVLEECQSIMTSVNFDTSVVKFDLNSNDFNITPCEVLNVSIPQTTTSTTTQKITTTTITTITSTATTSDTTTTTTIKSESNTIGVIFGVILVCIAVVIFLVLWWRRTHKFNPSSKKVTEEQHYLEIDFDTNTTTNKAKDSVQSNVPSNCVNHYASVSCNEYATCNKNENKSGLLVNDCEYSEDNHTVDATNTSIFSAQNGHQVGKENARGHDYSTPMEKQDESISGNDVDTVAETEHQIEADETATPNVYSHLGQTIANFTETYDDISSFDARRNLTSAYL